LKRIKQSFEVDAPPVGENWRGGVRKCACLAEDCSTSLLLLFLYLCHVMPFIIRQQHGQSRSADVALMCLILCSVAATLISLCLSVCVCVFVIKKFYWSWHFHLDLLAKANIESMVMIDW